MTPGGCGRSLMFTINRLQRSSDSETGSQGRHMEKGTAMACGGFFFVVLVQLGCAARLTTAFPADVLCLGKEQNGQVHYKVTPDITEEIHDCDIQWLVNDRVCALFDGNRKTGFEPPIVNATVNAAIVENGSDKLEYIFICPSINVDRRLPCSCSNSTFLGSQPKNWTFATKEGYPHWWIPVVVTAVIMLLFAVITPLVCKMVRKKHNCFQKVENETL